MVDTLMLVDAQRNMLEGEYRIPNAVEIRQVLAELLERARLAHVPIVHVQNDGVPGDPDEPDSDGWRLVFQPKPDEIVVRKNTSDTFAANPELALDLTEMGVNRVVLAGMQSDYCIRATARGAQANGLAVILVADGHATYDDVVTAAEASAAVERELVAAGVQLLSSKDIEFSVAQHEDEPPTQA